MAETLTNRTVTGAGWSALSQVVTQGFTFALGITLARLLGPKSYGLVGMVTLITGFAAVFGDFGLGAAIIQRKDLQPRHLNAAFWVNVLLGVVLTLAVMGLAPLVAWFFREPLLIPLTMSLALRFVISSLTIVQIALFNRQIQFRRIARIQMTSAVIGGLVGLGMALFKMGPWSLVFQSLAADLASMALAWNSSEWRPKLSYEHAACIELFGFSGYVLSFNVLNFLDRNVDNLLIGRSLGPLALGVYSRAYELMLKPLAQVAQVVGRVMYPALSEIQGDQERVRRAYLRAIRIISLITFPMMVGLFATSEHFILALLGDKWAPTIPILNMFCWVGILQSISTTTGVLFMSQGKVRQYFMLGVVFSGSYVVAFFIGIHWGLKGVVWSYVIVNLLEWYPLWYLTARSVGLTFTSMVRAVCPSFLCSLAMGTAVRGISGLLLQGTLAWQALTIEVLSGVIVYAALIQMFRLDAWADCRRVVTDSAGSALRILRLELT